MNRDSTFMRTAARIGDLGSPFYDEERQRDVWNEASAVGFQLQLWLGLVAATVAVWWAGGAAVPYALALVGITTLASIVTVTYASRLGVEVDDQPHLSMARVVPYMALLVVFVLGLVRAGAPYERDGGWGSMRYGFAQGAVIGLAGVAIWLAVRLVRERRRA
ncbi:DUF2029 domain-containing protein [Actinomarinicola tropica]|uniref:DUF2029 domain-containing protein n=1 Tax=Actinomarinicola tropica TaxID=2789776 RepID=A0A5Q2RQ37_9ACTN|nr:DUF2029 domain-containing protein [Actinomarinicola tropica]QGG96010.1 DUF2029 domain-containing protein [Actinomarinicola tropica]